MVQGRNPQSPRLSLRGTLLHLPSLYLASQEEQFFCLNQKRYLGAISVATVDYGPAPLKDTNPRDIPSHQLPTSVHLAGQNGTAPSRILAQESVSEALLPRSEAVKKRFGALVINIVRSLWLLRTATNDDQAHEIIQGLRDSCSQCLIVHQKDCVVRTLERSSKENDNIVEQRLIKKLIRILQVNPELAEYQKGLVGLSAVPYEEWIQTNLVGEGRLTVQEANSMPRSAYRHTIPGLYTAIYNAMRRKGERRQLQVA